VRRSLPNASILLNSLRFSNASHQYIAIITTLSPNEYRASHIEWLHHIFVQIIYLIFVQSVYWNYMHITYYAYNEKFLDCTGYYAYLNLICTRQYVFLLANSYAKRYVRHQTIVQLIARAPLAHPNMHISMTSL
jgi:hypothetical protein